MYVVPSFEIHNGPAGLFDYGPAACSLKSNMLALWRRHFVLEENMLEMVSNVFILICNERFICVGMYELDTFRSIRNFWTCG